MSLSNEILPGAVVPSSQANEPESIAVNNPGPNHKNSPTSADSESPTNTNHQVTSWKLPLSPARRRQMYSFELLDPESSEISPLNESRNVYRLRSV